MKVRTFNLGLLAVCAAGLLLVVPDVASAQACTQTLSTGANVASAVASAANDSTICLNSGNYGSVSFTNINRSGFVTVRSASGTGATMSPQFSGSRFIKLQSLTISGANINSCSNNIQLLNSNFTSGLLVSSRGSTCTANLNLLVDGNTFGNLGPATYEGRISVVDDDGAQPSMGLTISNNVIGPGCLSDGIQLAGGSSGVTIGPGNIFDGIVQSGPVHCDMIQFYGSGQNNTITGNWFKNGSVALTHHTATPDNTMFTKNVVSEVTQLQIGQSDNVVFEHNTIYNLNSVFTINSNSTNAKIRSNIFIGSTSLSTGDAGYGACVGCTVAYNLCDAGGCSGTNQVTGTPTFVGGAVPTTLAGWQLATNSIGRNAGHDGLDIGIGSGSGGGGTTPSAPSPPTNVVIVR